MKTRKNPKPSEQLRAFRKAARELGADESEDRFRDVLKTLGRVKPKTDEEIKKLGRRHRD